MTKKETENYRLKFLGWLSEYSANCRIREIENKERDDLTMQSCNDLFEEFFKKNQQFVNKQREKVLENIFVRSKMSQRRILEIYKARYSVFNVTKIDKEFDEELMEELADIEHQRWADWQKYMHSQFVEPSSDSDFICLPIKLFKRWERQIDTDYSELSEKEKQSDRNQVARYSPIIKQFIHKQIKRVIDEIKDIKFYT